MPSFENSCLLLGFRNHSSMPVTPRFREDHPNSQKGVAVSREVRMADAAIGFRVKSGCATMVLVTGSIQAVRVLDHRVIELCDRAIPESRQPYHAGMGAFQTDEAKVKPLLEAVVRVTGQSVAGLLKDYRSADYRIRAAGLVVGSEIDPGKITNPHIRAHALEGRLFRTALEDALQSCGLPSSVVVERSAYARAAQILKRSEHDLRSSVQTLGRGLGGPWRADEKTATLAAWLALV